MWNTLITTGTRNRGRHSRSEQKQGLEERWGFKKVFSCKFLTNLSRKRNFLTVQGDFDKIINVERTELCFLSG